MVRIMKNWMAGMMIFIILGAGGVAGAAERLTLMLDWFPNVDHLPIYVAQEAGLFKSAGLKVKILSPSETTDALKLAASNNVDLAVSYTPQAIMGKAEGLPIRVVGRLVEHPLSVLLFLKKSGIESPVDLEGKKIGYTVPGMMDILLEAFTAVNGIKSYESVNVGFSIVQSLVSGRVDAIMGPYKNYETVELHEKGYDAGYFELTQWGIPDYDELIFITGGKTMKDRSDAIESFTKAVDAAIRLTRDDPEKALEMYFRSVPDAPVKMETEAFGITLPLYASSQKLDMLRWSKFADFALRHGLIEKKVNVRELFQ